MIRSFTCTLAIFRAINFVDPTKHGFRLILREDFLREHMAPTLLPTLYVSAIPLRSGEATVSKVFYPDSMHEDKQVRCHCIAISQLASGIKVNIAELRDNSWYYLCIEWGIFHPSSPAHVVLCDARF